MENFMSCFYLEKEKIRSLHASASLLFSGQSIICQIDIFEIVYSDLKQKKHSTHHFIRLN